MKKDRAERYQIRYRFWEQLLERAKGRTKLHSGIAGFTLTAADPSPSTAFIGAAVTNTAGGSINVTNLNILGASSVLDCNAFTGIEILDGGGSVTNTTIDNLRRGLLGDGCQNGLGIRVKNSTTVSKTMLIDGNTVTRYNKNGITVSGLLSATVTNNIVTGAGPLGLGFAAQNGIQISFGATAKLVNNDVSLNNYTPSKVTACGLLLYKAGGVSGASKSGISYVKADNNFHNNETDICNFGKGRGFNPAP